MNFPPVVPPNRGTNMLPSNNMAGSNANYPPMAPLGSGANLPPSSPAPRRRGRGGIIAILILALIVILAGSGLYVFRNSFLAAGKTGSTSTATVTTSTTPTATTPSDATPTDTPVASTTPTDGTPTLVPTTLNTSNSYTAIQPGPGCDTNGGTWTPQDISNINCGTQLSVKGNTRGYLYLQLPNNKAFSTSNVIGVSSSLNSGSSDCVGLAEQGANTGYLAQYCGNGNWSIYSISSGGAVVQTLAKNLTSTRANEQLSLTIKGTMLSFSIDTEVHNVAITVLQPTKVAIAYLAGYYDSSTTVTNFSYTAS